MAREVTLVDPEGRTCVVGSPEEVNNLLCEGYRIQRPTTKSARKPSPEKTLRGTEDPTG